MTTQIGAPLRLWILTYNIIQQKEIVAVNSNCPQWRAALGGYFRVNADEARLNRNRSMQRLLPSRLREPGTGRSVFTKFVLYVCQFLYESRLSFGENPDIGDKY